MRLHVARGARTRLRGGLAKKLLLLLGTTLLAALAMEWAVGRYFPVGGRVYAPAEGLLFDAVPGASRIQVMAEPRDGWGEGDAARVLIRIGAEGYRGGDLEVPKRRKRVLVIGDSLVMAENVPVEGTFVRALGRELSRRLAENGAEDSIETVNAGRSGYGPDQALLLLERDVERVDPDLVVCVLCAHNDFGDLMRNKLFRLGDDGTAEPAAPVLGGRMLEHFAEKQERSEKPALIRLWDFWKEGRDRKQGAETVGAGMMSLYAIALASQASEHLVERNTEVVQLWRDVYDIDVAASLPDSFASAKVDLMTGVLARMVGVAREAGVPIAFVVVPSAVDVAEDFGVKVDASRFPSHSPTALVDAMVGAVGLAGGVAIDVTPALVGGGTADRYFVGGLDMHWNAAGQGVSASYVAEELLRDKVSSQALGSDGAR